MGIPITFSMECIYQPITQTTRVKEDLKTGKMKKDGMMTRREKVTKNGGMMIRMERVMEGGGMMIRMERVTEDGGMTTRKEKMDGGDKKEGPEETISDMVETVGM